MIIFSLEKDTLSAGLKYLKVFFQDFGSKMNSSPAGPWECGTNEQAKWLERAVKCTEEEEEFNHLTSIASGFHFFLRKWVKKAVQP